jgi:hypothetical protein
MLTGHRAFFWMDPEEVGSRELVVGYCIGFVSMGPASESKITYKNTAMCSKVLASRLTLLM